MAGTFTTRAYRYSHWCCDRFPVAGRWPPGAGQLWPGVARRSRERSSLGPRIAGDASPVLEFAMDVGSFLQDVADVVAVASAPRRS